ncbi:hypothetical protein XH88_12900 [Bradyrhizobium sp. CCBAU 51627]|nr:hypothetical protein [Bradyrhizobium sp. CCBAU 51627]
MPEGAVVIADPNLIFHGEFKRTGPDLVLSHDGHDFVVHDYFRGDKRAAIASPDGAHLTGDIISALTGYVQVAQAAPGAAAAQVIGHVTKLTGSATAIRNGVSVILNNGDNVEKGDVVSTGSESTLGISFIDGTVFGLSSNARMVLNEMVYDPNGSNNSSLLSLVAGTITFVAGETAKHGDMKIDTPVATMGIRGTAVLTEISFIIPPATPTNPNPEPQPQANFQVLVEPNGTTGSYILFDKLTLLPIATVNQAGQMIQISGGNVSVTNALLSPDVQKLITDVFTLKFTDNNTNTKLTTNFTDTITQNGNIVFIKTDTGATATATFTTPVNTGTGPGHGGTNNGAERFPGPPDARILDASGNVVTAFKVTEHANATNDRADTGGTVSADTIVFRINFVDQNVGDRPTVSVDLDASHYTYTDSGHHDVTASLTALQKQYIAATQIKISIVADAGNNNNGSAVGTYTIPDHAFDFLGAGETLTLTYIVSVDDNFAVNPETRQIPITITITGTNDKPVIATSVPTITFSGGTSVPGGPLTTDVPTTGTLTFTDVDLTDTHTVSVALTSASLPDGTTVPPGPLAAFQHAMSVAIANGFDSTGTGTGTINWSLADLPVYLADFIPEGEVLTLVYTVTVADEHNATSQQTIAVTIKGTDAPAVVWIATNQPSGGFWKDAANWETGTVPTSSDDVIVITDQLHGLTPSYPVTIDVAAYGKSLTMDDYDTTVHHTAPQVINHGTLTLTGALTLNADAEFTNAPDGIVLVGGAIDVETITRAKTGEAVVNTATITNAGTLTLAAGGKIDTLTTIVNSGMIDLSGGTLTLESNIANAGGIVQVESGAALFADTVTVDGGTVAILGTLELDGTSLIENGRLNNWGVVNVKGAAEFANEIVNNSGSVNVDAGGKLVINGTTIDGGVPPVPHGGAGGGEGEGGADPGSPGGTVTNDGELDLTGNAVLSNGILKNNATLDVSGTGNALNGEAVTNAGTIEVRTGALALGPGSTVDNSTGNVIVDAAMELNGTTISGGAVAGDGSIDVTGASRIDSGATLSVATVVVDAGLTLDGITVSGSVITDNAGIELDNLVKLQGDAKIQGGPVTNKGTLEIAGAATLLGVIVTNSGTVQVDDGQTLTMSSTEIDGGTLTIAGMLVSTGVSAITDADITNTGAFAVTSGKLTIDSAIIHTLTNHKLIQANGGELDISGERIVNTADIKAVGGGILKLTSLTVTNDGGSVTIDGTSNLYLSDTVAINGGSLNNSGHLFGVSGGNTISAAVTNTGTIEVQADTLNLSGGLTGVGSLVIDDQAKLELGGADAQTVTFAGGTGTLQLDKVAGQGFTGTIAGQSSTGGTFMVTGAGDITAASGDALDFTASGGTSDSHADIVLTPTGALTGAANGVVVTQNGVGDISLTATKDIAGLAGNGVVLRDGASGLGNVTIANLTGKAIGTGATSEGILVENLNAANTGDISITQLGGAAGGAFGIDATTHGGGDVTIDAGGNITGSSTYGIRARSYGSGDVTVSTEAGSVVTSGSSGIVAVNRATSIDASADSEIIVNAYGTINSGSSPNQSGNTPSGIQAGYNGATTGSAVNTNVNGSVVINNYADITSGGHGIHAYNYGSGDISVNDGAGTSVTGAVTGIKAVALGGGTGDVNVSIGANAHVTGTSGYGIDAYSLNAGDISVTMSEGDVVASGSVGIDAVNEATAIGSDVQSTILVRAHGTIHSGTTNTQSGNLPAGIMAGYTAGGSGEFSGAVQGDVTVESDATITADRGFGIEAFTWGMGDITVTAGKGSSITAAGTAIGVFDHGGGDVSVTNEGSATGAIGLSAFTNGAGNITIINDGDLTGTGTFGINVSQDLVGATGSTHITNTGTVFGADGNAAISVHENATGTALIDNSGTIGPHDAGSVTATTYAILETGGAIEINNTGHINGNISVASATFDNKSVGTWTVSGTSVFGTHSTIDNAGEIDLHDGASISSADGGALAITNSGEIESWGTAVITGAITTTDTSAIEVHTGTLTLYGSLAGAGTVTIDAGATLDVDATVSQTITFGGNGAELEIDTTSFSGSVAGFAATDKLDLSSIVYDAGTSATYDAETGDLVVSDAYGHSITVKLVGADYSNAHLAGSSDGHGGTLITYNALDDKPAFDSAETSQSAVVTEQSGVTGSSTSDQSTPASGTIDFSDIDLTDRPTATITGQSATWLDADGHTQLTLTPGQASALENALSVLTAGKNNGAVDWSYSIQDSALDFLGQGQTATVVSTITLNDHHGGTDTAQVTVTINGANDAPSLAAVTTGPLLDTAATDSFPDLTGKLVGTDADSGETTSLTYSVLNADAHGTAAGHYGALTVNSDGTYDYVPDAAAINALTAGSYIDTFTIQTQDVHGATGTATFTVNVTGANDAPTLSNLNAGTLTDTAAADTFSNLTGKLAGTDADTGETATLTYAVLNADHVATTTVSGLYGSLTVGADGSYSYVPNAAAIDALSAGQYTDSFTVQTKDVHGATGTATLTVDVTGANDSPLFNVDNISAIRPNDDHIFVHGLAVTDADAAADETFTLQASTAESGSSVSPSSRTGALDTINSALQTITYNEGSGEPATDKVTLTVTDGHGATDMVNLIFNLAENSEIPANLSGTTGKDVFFGTGYQEQFVFAANSSHDTIVNFTPNQDQINLSAVVTTDNVSDWMAQHVAASPTNSADTVITIDSADTILLKGVTASSLHASDFIVHS